MAAGNITVNYVPDGNDWQVTVASDTGVTKTATAPGLIAARDQADQLIEEILPGSDNRVVVHLLDGDGFAFSMAYLQARHGLSDEATSKAAEQAAANASSAPSMPGAHRGNG